MTKNIESFAKYNVRLGDINKIQNIILAPKLAAYAKNTGDYNN